MKNSIIAAIIIMVMIGNIAKAASPAQIASYKWQSNISDTAQRNAFRRMEMVKIVNNFSDGMKANVNGDSVADWNSYKINGVMDETDMGIIKNIINPFFDNNPTTEGAKDANGNSVW